MIDTLFSLLMLLFHLFFMFVFVFYCGGGGIILEFHLFDVFSWDVSLMFIADWISCCFGSFVFLISSMVLLYSGFYMHSDMNYSRFIWVLILFVLSMMLLVFSPSLLSLMLGWDGLGVVSFYLVMYYNNMSSLRSALVTVYTNRLGDAALVLAIVFMFSGGSSLMVSLYSVNLNILFFLIVLGGITSSAQFPFFSWLPAAMAAPTPISSLVHSSTLVTAGVYLFIRLYYLSSWWVSSGLLMLMSIITMVSAGFMALSEMDMKKIVAMSTLSQLGLMVFFLSVGELKCSFFHMVTHALFKALLFLSCGSFIFNRLGSQDSRLKGGMSFSMPVSISGFTISSLGLIGFPFMSGFYSSDLILDSLFFYGWGLLLNSLFMLGCVLTVFYSLRMFSRGLLAMSDYSSQLSLNESIFFSFSMPLMGVWASMVGSFVGSYMLMEDFLLSFVFAKMLGVFILILGLTYFLFYSNDVKLFKLSCWFSEMMFLNWATGSGLSLWTKVFNASSDSDLLWPEHLGGKGSFLLVSMGSSKLNMLEISFFRMSLMLLFSWFFVGVFLALYYLLKLC